LHSKLAAIQLHKWSWRIPFGMNSLPNLVTVMLTLPVNEKLAVQGSQ